MSGSEKEKPTELLIRLDERFANFEKTMTMMFDEMMLKHKEILHRIEKKADTHLLDELEEVIKDVRNDIKSNRKRVSKLEQWRWWLTGAFAVAGTVGGVMGTFIVGKL